MSENKDDQNKPIPNESWLLIVSESARRTLNLSQRSPMQIAIDAFQVIIDNIVSRCERQERVCLSMRELQQAL